MRIGNGAANQLQLVIYGELIDSVYLYNKHGTPIYHDAWEDLSRIVEWVCEHWDQADEGIWETRGGRRHFTYSRLMSWVAVERAVRIARQRGLPADLVRWTGARDAIHHQIMDRGWDERRGAFVQHYDTDVLDASVLLMPLVKFIAPTDPRAQRKRAWRVDHPWPATFLRVLPLPLLAVPLLALSTTAPGSTLGVALLFAGATAVLALGVRLAQNVDERDAFEPHLRSSR